MELLLKEDLINRRKEKFNPKQVLSNKVVALYFSAHWCPPCRSFSPVLESLYRECKKDKLDFEIIFVSFDKTEREMMSYMNEVEMSWYAIPFNDPRREQLSSHFRVYSLPTLLVLDKQGNVITTNGRIHIQMKGKQAIENYISGVPNNLLPPYAKIRQMVLKKKKNKTMERYNINGNGQAHINAYLEYRMIVGSKYGPNDPLLSEQEYEKLRKEFYAKKGPIILMHGQPKTKKLLDKNFDPSSEPLIQGLHLEDFETNKPARNTKTVLEEDKLLNLCNQELTLQQLRQQYPNAKTTKRNNSQKIGFRPPPLKKNQKS